MRLISWILPRGSEHKYCWQPPAGHNQPAWCCLPTRLKKMLSSKQKAHPQLYNDYPLANTRQNSRQQPECIPESTSSPQGFVSLVPPQHGTAALTLRKKCSRYNNNFNQTLSFSWSAPWSAQKEKHLKGMSQGFFSKLLDWSGLGLETLMVFKFLRNFSDFIIIFTFLT
jgi:hypothetical protein